MNPTLARKLIGAKAIRAGSTCEFFEPGHKRLAIGSYAITGARAPKDGGIVLEVISHNGTRIRIDTSLVHTIDGMPVARLAALFNMNMNGDPIPVGRRRGRKPRRRDIEMVCEEDEEEDACVE